MLASIDSPQQLENRFLFEFTHILYNLISNCLDVIKISAHPIMEFHLVDANHHIDQIAETSLIDSFANIFQNEIPESTLLV